MRERKELEEQIGTHKHKQTKMSKATMNIAKKEKVLVIKIHEREIKAANLQNELVRLRIDAINTQAHSSQLKEKLNKELTEIREKDNLIEKEEAEICRQHNEIGKKMNQALSTHVPNLVESTRVGNRYKEAGAPGDGRYQCRLHQKGAQKIIGFEFGTSVTMDMQESMGRNPNEEQSIVFKCVDSQFFTEFDGEWKVVSSPDPLYTTVKYVVDVRPKGPVPVAALEWRIKEDVPVNLKAVKKAAMKGASDIQVFSEINSAQSIISAPLQTQRTGITSQETLSILETVGGHVSNVAAAASAATSRNPRQRTVLTRKADWNEDETTAAYLNDWTRDPSFDWYGDETTGAYLDDMAFSQRV